MNDTANQLPSASIEIEVPFADVDAQRIVWHGNYLRYFELARTELLRQCDLNSMLVDGRYQFVVSDTHCRHYRPLRFGDRCTIEARIIDVDHRINIRYHLANQAGERVAVGHTHLVTLNREGELQFVTPQEILDHIDRLAAAQAAQPDMTRRRFVVATAALFGALALPQRAQAAATLPPYVKQLLATHKNAKFLEARFIEEKHIAFLKAPLRSEGSLCFAAPQTFARTTDKPGQSKLLVKDKQIAFREGDGPVTRLALDSRPELKALVEGILLLFAGDEAAISERFELKVDGASEAWTLELLPKDSSMKKLVQKIVVKGKAAELASFQVHEASGDYSETTLQELRFNRALSAEEKAKLFSI